MLKKSFAVPSSGIPLTAPVLDVKGVVYRRFFDWLIEGK